MLSPTVNDHLRSAGSYTGQGGPVTESGDGDCHPAACRLTIPSVVSFTRSASTIQQGGSVVISWVTANGDTRDLIEDPDDAPFTTYPNQAASGSRTFTLTVTTEFQIQVFNAADPPGTLDNAFITVTVTDPAATIDSFTVSDSSPDADENFTLSWTTTGATRVILQRRVLFGNFAGVGGDRPADGSYTTSQGAVTQFQYRIIAYNALNVPTVGSSITITIP